MVKVSGLWSLEPADLSNFKSEQLQTWSLFVPCLMGHPIDLCCLSKRGSPSSSMVKWMICSVPLKFSECIEHACPVNFEVMILLWFCGLCSSQCEFELSVALCVCANRESHCAFFFFSCRGGFSFPLLMSSLINIAKISFVAVCKYFKMRSIIFWLNWKQWQRVIKKKKERKPSHPLKDRNQVVMLTCALWPTHLLSSHCISCFWDETASGL